MHREKECGQNQKQGRNNKGKTAIRTYLKNLRLGDNVKICYCGIHVGTNVKPEYIFKSMNKKIE